VHRGYRIDEQLGEIRTNGRPSLVHGAQRRLDRPLRRREAAGLAASTRNRVEIDLRQRVDVRVDAPREARRRRRQGRPRQRQELDGEIVHDGQQRDDESARRGRDGRWSRIVLDRRGEADGRASGGRGSLSRAGEASSWDEACQVVGVRMSRA
jgi:hypothetical protein